MELENMHVVLALSIISMIVLTFYFFKSKSINSSKGNLLPPGSFGWPIIGETFAFINEAQQNFVGDRMRKYSPKIFKTNIFGEPTVVLCGIDGHKFISSNEGKLFIALRPKSMQKLFRDSYQKAASAALPRSAEVHVIRAPGFLKAEALVQCVGKMDSTVQEHLKLHWDGKTEVEVYSLAQLLTVTLCAQYFMGLEDNDRAAKFAQLMNIVTLGLHTLPVNVPGTTFYRAMKAADALRKEILLFIKEKKEAAMCGGNKMNDIMSFMMFNTDPTGRFLPENEVADKTMGLLAGGFHSPSMATSFLIKFLGERPEICDKVRAEHLEIASSKKSGEALDWHDIQKMKYSWSVTLEVMRLIPPLQGTFREAIADFTYDGYTVPKGWTVYWSASSTNKALVNFAKPEEFDPKRFENGGPPAYSNIPFGSGPRICPGREYARLLTLCSLHHIVTKYKWEVKNPSTKITGGMNPVPEQGIHILIQPYLP